MAWPNFGGASLAILGYLFTYWHTKKSDERKANIERINEQLRELYGPLLASITATGSAYRAMVKSAEITAHDGRPVNEVFRAAVQSDPRGKVAEIYRQWMKHVLQPLNEQAADLIMRRLDLLESDQTSAHLLTFVAHVSANRVVLKQWDAGDLDAHSNIPFPDELADLIVRQFDYIKHEQASLLGVKHRSKL